MAEYVGYRDPIDGCYDAAGNQMFNMGVTDEEIIRCRDCGRFTDGLCGLRKGIGYFAVEPDGFCAWAERRES